MFVLYWAVKIKSSVKQVIAQLSKNMLEFWRSKACYVWSGRAGCFQGRQQNPERGTLREHPGTGQIITKQMKKKKKKERKRLKKQPKNERTNKENFKKGVTVVQKTSLSRQFYHVIFKSVTKIWISRKTWTEQK